MTGRQDDERLLIDLLLGRCDQQTYQRLRERLASDPQFAALHRDLEATFAALETYDAPEPPANLVDRTLARVRALRRTEAMAEARPGWRGGWGPTFSLRELTAMAAAAVLFVGILVPALRQAGRVADRNLCASNLGQIGTALNHYANGNEDALPAAPAEADCWLGGPGGRRASNSAALFLLVRLRHARPEVFQCPAAGGSPFQVGADMRDFPTPRSIGYSYQFSIGRAIRRSDPAIAGVTDQYAIASDENPVFPDGLFKPERLNCTVSDNHPDGGQNVLYLDGHVQWTDRCDVGVAGNNIWLIDGVYNYTGRERPASPTDTFLTPNR